MNEALFEKYLKGELTEDEARTLKERLEDPETAREFVLFVQEWAVVADLAGQMSARGARPIRTPSTARRVWLPVAAAAALLLAGVAVLRSDRAPAPVRVPPAPVAARPEPAIELVPPLVPVPEPEVPRPAPAPAPPPAPPVQVPAPPPAAPPAPPAPPPPAKPAPPTAAEPAFATLEEGPGAGGTLAEGAGLRAAERTVIRLSDGTRLELGPKASVDSIARTPSGLHLALSLGPLRATVAPQPKDRPFTIATPHAVATATGTELSMSVAPEGTLVASRSGGVRLARKGDPASAVTLLEGQSSSVLRASRGSLPIEMSFQDGVAPGPGYAGTADAELSELEPAAARGAKAVVEVDGDERDGKALAGALRWDLGAVPPGARVREAWITLTVVEPSASGAYFAVPLKRAWTEGEATWLSAAGRPAGAPVLAELHPRETGELSAMLNDAGLAQLQAWIRQPATNHGILLGNDANSNGFSFESREAKAPERRPKLSVVFTVPAAR